jgi:WD40 repeat protein
LFVVCLLFLSCHSERTKTVWTGGGDFNILGWSAMDKKRNGVCLQGHTDWVRCLLVCNGRLWSGSDDKTIRMWAESGSNSSPAAVVESHRGGVLCIARVGDAVWSGGADRQICRFDLAGSEKTAPLTAHKGRVMAIESCGKSVWSGSSDRHCLVWSLTTQRVLSDLNDFGGAVGAIAAVDGW